MRKWWELFTLSLKILSLKLNSAMLINFSPRFRQSLPSSMMKSFWTSWRISHPQPWRLTSTSEVITLHQTTQALTSTLIIATREKDKSSSILENTWLAPIRVLKGMKSSMACLSSGTLSKINPNPFYNPRTSLQILSQETLSRIPRWWNWCWILWFRSWNNKVPNISGCTIYSGLCPTSKEEKVLYSP